MTLDTDVQGEMSPAGHDEHRDDGGPDRHGPATAIAWALAAVLLISAL